MKILSVNTSIARELIPGMGETGLDKRPVSGWVEVTELGLAGDVQVHRQSHGGSEQAVYLYGQPDYDWWANKLERALHPGQFGENLTISDVGSADLCIGDRLTIGDVLLEVTSPRMGCNMFEVWMGIEGYKVWFDDELRPGAYCRVLKTGQVMDGQTFTIERYAGERVSVGEVVRLIKQPDVTPAELERALTTPMNPKHKRRIQTRLDDMTRA